MGPFFAHRAAGVAVACALAVTLQDGAAAQRERVSEAEVRAHMSMLASDALNGRGSGTRDEWIAATYVASQLQRWGVEPIEGATELVHTIETERVELAAPPTLHTGTLVFSHGRDMLVRAIGAPAVSGPLVRFVPGVDIGAGAVVLVAGPDLPPADAIASAAAVIEAETPEVRAAWAATTAGVRATASTGRPWRVVLDASAFLAMSRVAHGSTVYLEAITRPVRTWNVVGRLPGRDSRRSSEVILLSAHLDHVGSRGSGDDTIYNGADDDASGVTAVLELVRVLAEGPRPRRTVMVALFGSEESGGAGSRAFVERPPVPLERIVANLQFEMIGRPDPAIAVGALWLTGFDRSTLGAELTRRGARLVTDPRPEQQFFDRSDNIRFAQRGVVAHTVSSYGLHEHYHTPADDLSRINFPHMVRAIASMLVPIEWLANSTFIPAWHEGRQPTPAERPARP
jgi:aminopeptidase YwaD